MTNIDTALNKQQHAFLQALMARGVMPEKAAVKMYAEMLDLDMAEANKLFSRFWSPIASALGYLDLDIRVIRHQEDQQLYMGVVNKTGGEAAKLATRLTPEQIALFRMVLDEILRDDTSVERGVDVISALNATQAAPTTQGETADGGLSQAQTQSVAKMSKTDKEATLKHLCADGWLAQTDDAAGFLKLGVRAFLELKEFLLEQAPERARAKWEKML